MPALDNCEPQMINAFKKAEWNIRYHPFSIPTLMGNRHVFADLCLYNAATGKNIIVVEIKCFPPERSQLDEFYHGIGQYQVYGIALELNHIDVPLYLAVPQSVYEAFFQHQLIKTALERLAIRLVVVNLETEEVTQWIS